MQQNVIDILISALRSVISDTSEHLEYTHINEEQKKQLFKLSAHHDVAHLIYDPLLKSGIVEKGEEAGRRLDAEKMKAIYRSARIERELSSVSRLFSEAGIDHVLLKGAVIRRLYPESWMRTSCDIDILVRESELERAISVLTEQLSYKTDGERHFHDVSLYSPSGVHLELHFSILEHSESLDKVLCRAWDYVVPTSENGYAYAFTPEFLFFHVIAHNAYHFSRGGCGIKAFIDFYLLNKNLSVNSQKLSELCREAGVESFMKGMQELASVWFNRAEHNQLTLRMEQFVLTGGVYGTHRNRITVAQNKAGGKAKRIFSMIFPPVKNMHILYPVLKKHPILLPFCYVARPFKIVFSGRLGKSLDKLKQENSTSRQERDRVAKLFGDLGI